MRKPKNIAVVWARNHKRFNYGQQVEVLDLFKTQNLALIDPKPFGKYRDCVLINMEYLWTDTMGYIHGTDAESCDGVIKIKAAYCNSAFKLK